jgi:hypothetical protein
MGKECSEEIMGADPTVNIYPLQIIAYLFNAFSYGPIQPVGW